MRRKGYWPDRDPVGRRVGEDLLGRALRSVLSDAQRRLLLDYLHGAPPKQLASQLGVTVDQLQALVAALLAKLRDSPTYGEQLMRELRSGFPQRSPIVWEGVKEVPVHRCERAGCTERPFVQKPTGRPRRWCSSRCRQAAYRQAKRDPVLAQRRAEARLEESVAARPFMSSAWFARREKVGRRRRYRLHEYSDALAPFPVSGEAPPWVTQSLQWNLKRWLPSPPRDPGPLGTLGVGLRAAWSGRCDAGCGRAVHPSVLRQRRNLLTFLPTKRPQLHRPPAGVRRRRRLVSPLCTHLPPRAVPGGCAAPVYPWPAVPGASRPLRPVETTWRGVLACRGAVGASGVRLPQVVSPRHRRRRHRHR